MSDHGFSLRHTGTDRPWDPAPHRGPMPPTVLVHRQERPEQWEAIRQIAARFPFVRLLEEPVRERVLEYPTTVSIDVVLGWPLAEQDTHGGAWGDVIHVRLETPGRRYPLGAVTAHVRDGALERETFRQHEPLSGEVVWHPQFEAWLTAIAADMLSMAQALIEKGWLTPDGRPARDEGEAAENRAAPARR